VVDLDSAGTRLAEHDLLQPGVGLGESACQHYTIVRAGAPGSVLKVSIEDVVAGIAAVVVDIAPGWAELSSAVPGLRASAGDLVALSWNDASWCSDWLSEATADVGDRAPSSSGAGRRGNPSHAPELEALSALLGVSRRVLERGRRRLLLDLVETKVCKRYRCGAGDYVLFGERAVRLGFKSAGQPLSSTWPDMLTRISTRCRPSSVRSMELS
jgi:hypothetical protein